jgi:hypothetical protein
MRSDATTSQGEREANGRQEAEAAHSRGSSMRRTAQQELMLQPARANERAVQRQV